MSRGFFSGGSKKGKNKPGKGMMGKIVSQNRDKTLKQKVEDKTTHQTKDYKEMLEDLIDEKMFSTDPRKNNFHMKGTQAPEDRKMSKGYMMAMEHAKMKRAKQRMKQRDKKVDITPMSFGDGEHGGRLTKDGRIMNNKGQVLFEVDEKTGIVKNKLGIKVAKYKPNSTVFQFKIEKMIAKESKSMNTFNPFAGKGESKFNPFGGDD